jgi:phosphoribosyl 1,2-cyclic phosphodiesterase
MTDGLKDTGTPEEQFKAILITHEHIDHVNGLKTSLKKYKHISVYGTKATFDEMKYRPELDRQRPFVAGDRFSIGDMEIETFSVSHDAADPVGYSIRHDGKQVSIVTDTGILNDDILDGIKDADILIMEANHDVNMLKCGAYPYYLKQRILGEQGHLSNEAAGHGINRLMEKQAKARCILLAHLSSDNNHPEMAEQTVVNILEDQNWLSGRDVYVKTINRNEISLIYEI